MTDNFFFVMTFFDDVTTEAPLVRVAPGVTRIPLAGLFVHDANARVLLLDQVISSSSVTIVRKKWPGQFSRGTVDHGVFAHTQ